MSHSSLTITPSGAAESADGQLPTTGTDDFAERPLRLSIRNVTKQFGATKALRGVDFDLRAGEVHALLGENGAGKSTLMNVMSGVITDFGGTMYLDGEPTTFSSPAAAQRSGIATVFQELDLVGGLTVSDNLSLGREPVRAGWVVDAAAMRRSSQSALSHVGSAASPRDLVSSLRLGDQQTVMIAKALSQQARVLILDEPTAALTSSEVTRLFELVREVASRGVSVVYVSHRLEEIPEIADRVTVLREGSIVGTVAATTPQTELVRLLTGRESSELFPPKSDSFGAVSLSLDELTFSPRSRRAGWRAPRGVSLQVREGEIVGLVGLLGAGRTELLEVIAGAAPEGRLSGTVSVSGRRVSVSSVSSSLAAGIAYVPDDRRAGGFVPQRTVGENLLLPSLRRFSLLGFVRPSRMIAAVTDAVARFGIKASSPNASILSLSGGNQQKVVVGRALLGSPTVLLLDEPTRGVDIGAKADIYRLIRSETARGMSVLIASSELPELIGLCDRLIVLREGEIVAEPESATDGVALIGLAQHAPTKEERA